MRKMIVVHREGGSRIGYLPRVFASRKDAAETAGAHLWSAHGVHLTDANRIAALLMGAGGECEHIVTHAESGMEFRILPAHFTSDRKAIFPGMRVTDYDREAGEVAPGQFMDEGAWSPGGPHFDGWYAVRKDSGTFRKFNGERLHHG